MPRSIPFRFIDIHLESLKPRTPLKGTTINLWGIDTILKDCCDFVFTSVMAQSQIKDSTLMRGLTYLPLIR